MAFEDDNELTAYPPEQHYGAAGVEEACKLRRREDAGVEEEDGELAEGETRGGEVFENEEDEPPFCRSVRTGDGLMFTEVVVYRLIEVDYQLF